MLTAISFVILKKLESENRCHHLRPWIHWCLKPDQLSSKPVFFTYAAKQKSILSLFEVIFLSLASLLRPN